MPTTRPLPFAATMRYDGMLDVDNEGLVSGHRCLCTRLAQVLTDLGCQEDPCCQRFLTLTGRNRGVVRLDVDDLIGGGDQYHPKTVSQDDATAET